MPFLSRARVVTSPPMPPPTTITLFNVDMPFRGSIRLGARKLHYLPPFFGFRCDERSEFGGCACERGGAETGKLSLYLRVCKARVDLAVEPRDDVGWRVARCPDAVPLTGLESRYEIGDRGKIRQR